jgi:hypothetical protein
MMAAGLHDQEGLGEVTLLVLGSRWGKDHSKSEQRGVCFRRNCKVNRDEP